MSSEGSPEDEVRASNAVFRTPELLEMILANLSPIDTLQAQQVSQDWQDAILQSPQIKRMLGLRASRHFHSPFLSEGPAWCVFPGLTLFTIDSWKMLSPQGKAEPTNLTAGFAVSITLENRPSVGSRCREMLLCSPPVNEMKFAMFTELRTRWKKKSRWENEVTVAAPNGITVGHLLDAVDQFLSQTWGRIISNGRVSTEVAFCFNMELADHDPLMVARYRERKKIKGESHAETKQ